MVAIEGEKEAFNMVLGKTEEEVLTIREYEHADYDD